MANHLFTEAIDGATFAGKPLDEIDAETIASLFLSQRQKGALFLFADALRRRGEQRRLAQELLWRAVDADQRPLSL
jgi:hypothetical protein